MFFECVATVLVQKLSVSFFRPRLLNWSLFFYSDFEIQFSKLIVLFVTSISFLIGTFHRFKSGLSPSLKSID